MATGIKICKICGKEYPYCKTASVPGVFRWQDVACCEEHGLQYLQLIEESRKPKEEQEVKTVATKKKRTKKQATSETAEANAEEVTEPAE